MKGKWIGIFAVLAVSVLVAGCNVDGAPVVGNAALSIQATAPGSLAASVAASSRSVAAIARAAGDPLVIDLADGSLTLATVRLVLKEFEIEMVGVDADGLEFEMEGPYVVDLIQQTMDPVPAGLDLLPGTYDEIKFKIDKIEGDEDDEVGTQLVAADDPLFGHSMILEGSFTPTAGSAIPFTYTYDGDAEFELAGGGEGFAVSDTDVSSIIIAFRLARWFDGIDMTAFATSPDDVAYKEALKENIKNSADFGEDDDDDGFLESDEDDDPDGPEDVDD